MWILLLTIVVSFAIFFMGFTFGLKYGSLTTEKIETELVYKLSMDGYIQHRIDENGNLEIRRIENGFEGTTEEEAETEEDLLEETEDRV